MAASGSRAWVYGLPLREGQALFFRDAIHIADSDGGVVQRIEQRIHVKLRVHILPAAPCRILDGRARWQIGLMSDAMKLAIGVVGFTLLIAIALRVYRDSHAAAPAISAPR